LVLYELFQPREVRTFLDRTFSPVLGENNFVETYTIPGFTRTVAELVAAYPSYVHGNPLCLGITIIGVWYECPRLHPEFFRFDTASDPYQVDVYFAQRSGNNVFHVRVRGTRRQTLGLYLKTAIRASADYNALSISRRDMSGLMTGRAMTTLTSEEWGTSVTVFNWMVYGTGRLIGESMLIYMWLTRRIPMESGVSPFELLGDNVRDREILLLSPVGSVGFTLVILDNQGDGGYLVGFQDMGDPPYPDLLVELADESRTLQGRIRDMALMSTVMGETSAGLDCKLSETQVDPHAASGFPVF
jgi:hypothetical protein